VNKAGRTKAGKGRASPFGAFSAQTYCALLIAVAWKHFRGRYPGSRNRKAAQAAEAYWRATGTERRGWGSDPLTAWRPHFEKAQASTAADHLRAEFRRHLEEHARDWERRSRPDIEQNGN
jgi:hypothetical protein